MNKSFHELIYSEDKPLLVFDGGMGTSLQEQNLTIDEFGGAQYEGCNEYLVISKPSCIENVHRSFLDAGCDVIETDTFGASSIVLKEYGLENQVYEINFKAAQIAKKVAIEYSDNNRKRYVAGSIGPTTKLPSLGHISFDELKLSYKHQIIPLLNGGVDLLLIETCQDILQIKAALQAAKDSFKEAKIKVPLMVSVTIESTGTMLIGTNIESVVNILQPFDIDILGLNCATGPNLMKEHIKYLSEYSPFIISCIPNAGLPENVGGKAHYKLTAIELKMQLMHFVKDLGVQIIGGCCGTTSEHIKSLVQIKNAIITIKDEINIVKKNLIPSASSIYESVSYKQDNSFLIVGERLNASGSKKVRELLNINDWDSLVSLAKEQQKENAHILDVNVDYVGRDGVEDMKNLVSRLVNNIRLPLMLDSTEYEKMESGLKQAGGKCILNSTNYEDGPDRFFKVLELARDYGAGVVVGTIDEDGMARTSHSKINIVKRAYNDAVSYGISDNDLFFDPLALPISTGIEEDRANAKETIDSIKQIRRISDNIHIILGISNISFGLNSAARIILNSVFLDECLKVGLDSAIVSPNKILPLSNIDDHIKKICLDLIYDNRIFDNGICSYDPLNELTKEFEGKTSNSLRDKSESLKDLPLEERLVRHIIDGERLGIEDNLIMALKKYKPLHIINTYLLDGMKTVGELFGDGKMQLPFVLQSAQTMKAAVSILEPFMEKNDESNSKGKLLIATVKGDVHDIGKNLVDIILTNNGYDVINLGIKQEVTSIIDAFREYNPNCIAMSGLLVKSTAFMKENLSRLNEEDINVPVILGGAALTPKFVHKDCADVYNGKVIYGKDAFTDLQFMDSYMNALKTKDWSNSIGFKSNDIQNKYFKSNLSDNDNNDNDNDNDNNNNNTTTDLSSASSTNNINKHNTTKSSFIKPEKSIDPPFLGPKYLYMEDIDIKKLLFYLDKNALFSSQWQLKKRKDQTREEYNNYLKITAEPILDKWIEKIISNNLVQPSSVYGYFPCGRSDNDLHVFNPNRSSLLGKFRFPRQKGGNRYCIADFYNDLLNNTPTDFIPMQAVTMGQKPTLFAQSLYNNDKYADYLYFHGLVVQLTEAFAEYIHSIIRKECGFALSEPKTTREILAQRYRGSRYSFGYPACPNVKDSKLQLEWMDGSKIGLDFDESDQINPEQSTTAIVAIHSQARYFSA